MIELNKLFAKPTLEDWVDQLKKELRGADFENLLRKDKLEEISFQTFNHVSNTTYSEQIPGAFPFRRGYKNQTNDWKNAFHIKVTDEKKANSKALDVLMKGCDSLVFELCQNKKIDYNTLFSEIEFDYIESKLVISNEDQYLDIKRYYLEDLPSNLNLSIDLINYREFNLDTIIADLKLKQTPTFLVNGFKIQQCGAATWQEIAFCLATGHEYLVTLMKKGMSIDEASACIDFSVGIGSNYFYEISKLRALRQNWSVIINAYNPIHNCSFHCPITAEIGFMNKSLRDPHTNLLRQTTETMSAVIGGANTIIVHPYDSHSINGSTTFTERMALNSSLILKEEAYLDKVIDPLGGSYAIENLTNILASKSWELFQQIETQGGISETIANEALRGGILIKAEQRKEAVISGDSTLIGINKFQIDCSENNHFLPAEKYWGLQTIIFERDLFES